MVSILGEKTADALIGILIAVIGFLVARTTAQQADIAQTSASLRALAESQIDPREIAALQRDLASMEERYALLLKEIMRLRESIGEMVMPVIIEFIKRGMSDERFGVGGDVLNPDPDALWDE